MNFPSISESEIDELIKNVKPHNYKLPKLNDTGLTKTKKEIRKLYSRTYERWTKKKVEKGLFAIKRFRGQQLTSY